MPFLKDTMLATMCVVEMLEMSKHSMTSGRCGSWSASASALRSDTGLMLVGSEWRVNRRVGAVVRRRSSIMSRNCAAFSKSIRAGGGLHLLFEVAEVSRELPSRNSHAWSTRAR